MSKGYDPSRSSLDRLVKGSSRNIEITDKADQFLDVRVGVVPLFHHVRQIELASRSHDGIGEQNENVVKPVCSTLYRKDNEDSPPHSAPRCKGANAGRGSVQC